MFNTIPFLTYVVVANISPGPNAILSLSNASRYPLRKAIRFNLGIAVGVFAVMLLCGIFGLLCWEAFPPIQKILVWVGAVYLGLLFDAAMKEKKRKRASASPGTFGEG
ncbi:MAG: LysE family transporter [[Clostridium] scindens]